ncbi:MAG: PSD1 domain-containing protein [Acidobacteriia bacterium]|nr:PSD1 domain-containing protein [Terriglobia bacterium]
MFKRQFGFLLALGAWGQAPPEFFEARVRPVLAMKCQGCHNARMATAGLDLSTGAGFRKGADTGPVVASGDVGKSRLLQVISYEERIKMPPAGKLPESDISVLREWVERGAPWPDSSSAVAPGTAMGNVKASAGHWAFQPLRKEAPPRVAHESWVRSPIDRFILSKQEARQLRPAGAADRLTLLRRAAFDLTGLPPTSEDIRMFMRDLSPEAFASAVDRFLASPRYGEKWGRHWLDVARYADSTGADEDYRYPHAWRYRDYVIDAFNRDVPYTQFVREQIAGDLLPPPAGEEVNTTGIIATGFLALGPKLVAEQDKVKMFYDIVDEQIDVVGKAFLGLTISCARCHDHKFDPITIKDYYSLASIFASTRQLEQIEGTVSKLFYAPLAGKVVAERYASHQKSLANKQKEIDAIVATQARRYRDQLAPRIAAYMAAARRVYADGVSPAAAAQGLDEEVLERWVNYLKPTRERRPHLEAWYRMTSVDAAAAEYQANYFAEIARREKAQVEFKIASEAARAKGEPAPAEPKFPAGANRFFTEIVAAKGALGLPEKEPEKLYTEEARVNIAALRRELKEIKDSAPPEPPFACAVAEDKPVDQHVFLRGNPEAHGEGVPKRFPVVLAGEQQAPVLTGSGRRELASWLADPANPLPARVIVNRIWQGHFGQGLVRTANNFGVAGERPAHPELLDWLAAEFVAQGSSFKKMHRMIMLSSTYQMGGEATEAHREKDPDNRLLTRFAMRRKTVEEIRDSLLLMDGSLDFTMGGALATGTGTDNEFSDSRKSMHPDDSKRRTVYLPLRRSNLSTLFTLFDFGDATTSTEIREQTNVAPQALYMMNSKFVAERARALAQRLLRTETDEAARVKQAWATVLGREPEARETSSSLSYLAEFPKLPENDEGRLTAWASLCRTLIASNDFIYIQ